MHTLHSAQWPPKGKKQFFFFLNEIWTFPWKLCDNTSYNSTFSIISLLLHSGPKSKLCLNFFKLYWNFNIAMDTVGENTGLNSIVIITSLLLHSESEHIPWEYGKRWMWICALRLTWDRFGGKLSAFLAIFDKIDPFYKLDLFTHPPLNFLLI